MAIRLNAEESFGMKQMSVTIANRVASMENTLMERALSMPRMEYIKSMIKQGKALPFNWAIANLNGKEIRVDGQTTSRLLSDEPALIHSHKLYVTVSKFDCDTPKDVSVLYSQFNNKKSSRTTSDVNKAFACFDAGLRECVPQVINNAVSAMSYAQKGVAEKYASKEIPEVRAERLQTQQGKRFVLWLNNFYKSHVTRERILVGKVPAVAAIFHCWEKDVAFATKFWHEVVTVGGDYQSPSKLLYNFLNEHRLNFAGRSAKKTTCHVEMYAKCIHHWNAARQGTKVQRYTAGVVPEVA